MNIENITQISLFEEDNELRKEKRREEKRREEKRREEKLGLTYGKGVELYHGDALKVMDELIEKGIKVDLIITDPPYEVSVTNGGGSINTIKKFKNSTKQVAEAGIDNGYDFDIFIEKARKLQDKLNIYFWCNKKQIPMYISYFSKEKNILFDILFWNKKNAIPSYNNKYLSDCEYLLYFKEKGAYNKPQNYEDAKTCHLGLINHTDKNKYGHPTIKPLDFSEKVIRNSCPINGIVLDPFMGSGTNGVAALNNGRNFIGIELVEKWFNIAKQRNLGII